MADEEDEPTPYRLSRDAPRKRRHRPMKGFEASSPRSSDPFDQPVWKRFFGTDPFPWILALCTVLWIALGLLGRHHFYANVALIVAGIVICIGTQVWIYVAIFMEDTEAGVLSLLSGWYRMFYLHMNPELAWRPSAVAVVCLLMCLTGMGMLLAKPWAH